MPNDSLPIILSRYGISAIAAISGKPLPAKFQRVLIRKDNLINNLEVRRVVGD